MVTAASVVMSGFWMVRYSWKPPPTLPPSIYHVVAAGGVFGMVLLLSRICVLTGAAFAAEEIVNTTAMSRRASNEMIVKGYMRRTLRIGPLKGADGNGFIECTFLNYFNLFDN